MPRAILWSQPRPRPLRLVQAPPCYIYSVTCLALLSSSTACAPGSSSRWTCASAECSLSKACRVKSEFADTLHRMILNRVVAGSVAQWNVTSRKIWGGFVTLFFVLVTVERPRADNVRAQKRQQESGLRFDGQKSSARRQMMSMLLVSDVVPWIEVRAWGPRRARVSRVVMTLRQRGTATRMRTAYEQLCGTLVTDVEVAAVVITLKINFHLQLKHF